MTDLQSLARAALGIDGQDPKPPSAPRLPSAVGMPTQQEPYSEFTSPEDERAVRGSEAMDRASRAKTPENLALTRIAQEEEDQRMAHAALQDIAARAYAKSQEAHGFFENVGWQAAKFGKFVADGFVNTADLIHHAGRGVGGMFSGRGFGGGWEDLSRENQAIYGSSSPSILDLLPTSMVGEHAGQRADALMHRRLGESELIAEGLGMMTSFLLPGAPAGKIAQGAVRPLAGMVGRGAAKAALKEAGVGGVVAKNLVESGNAWQWLAQNPGMRRANNLFDASLRLAGRNVEDLMTTGADVVARAYSVAPDSERMHAAKSAAAMAPFMVPIARLGQSFGRMVLERGVDEQTAMGLKAAYEQFSAGKIGVEQLQNLLHSDLGLPRRIAASLITGAFEGTAFTGLQPDALDTLQKALTGDHDAMVKLRSMWLGNVLGTVGTKMVPGTPVEEFPFFRQSRPDLNRLETYLDAEANKRLLAQDPKPAPAPKPAEPPPDVRDPGELAARQAEAQRTAGTQAETEAALNAPVRDKSEIAEQQQRQDAYDTATAEQRDLEAMRSNLRQRYGWVDEPAAPLLRASWSPEFLGDTADVRMVYGRDHVVDLHQDGSLTINGATAEVLKQFGVEPAERDTIAPDRIKLQGATAKKALDDLALIGVLRRMQGDSIFERMGLREQEPGVWVDSDGNRRQMQLNGDSATSKPNGKWTGTDSHMVVGRDAETQQWDHPTLDVLSGWLMTKSALRPDPIVDELIGQVIDRARFGTNSSANELRRLIQGTDARAILEGLGAGTDREVGFLLSSIGAGNGNAMSVSAEMQARQQMAAAAEQTVTRDERADYFRTLRGEPPAGDPNTVEALHYPQGEGGNVREVRRLQVPKDLSGGDDGGEFRAAMEEGVVPQEPTQAPASAEDRMRAAATQYQRARGEKGLVLGAERSLSDLLREVQPGGEAESMAGIGPSKSTRRTFGKGVRGAHEFLLENQPEVLRKAVPGEKLPYEVRRTVAEGERLGDVFTAEFRPGERAIRTRIRDAFSKAERQTRRRVRVGTVESTTNPEASYMRWRLLADGKIDPENATERAFVDAYQKAGGAAYEAQRRAGAVRAYPQEKGPPKYEGLRKSERSVVPYRFTREFGELLNHPDTRRQTFEMFAGENPEGKMPQYERGETGWEYRGEGPVTADALEALFQKEMAGSRVDSALRESAAEHFRMLRNVPDVWKGTKILETDPMKAIPGSLRSQGRRAATLQQFGPDIPAAGRRAMLEEAAAREKADPEFAAGPAVEALRSGRLGVEERLGRFQEALTRSRELRGRNPETVMGIARDLLVRAQGGQPEHLWDITQSQVVQDFLGITNSFMASKGFVWDLLEPGFRTGAYSGYRKSIGTMFRLLRPKNFREMAEQVDRWGAAERTVADHLLDEAMSSPARALANLVQTPGGLTERWKQVFNAARADQIVQAIKKGRGTRNDFQLLEDLVRISPDDMMAAREGRIDAGLETQLRRELTSLFTSRGTRAEGSRYAASRNAGLITRFNRFATRRLEQSIKDVTAVARAAQRDGWAGKEAGTAMLRLVKVSTGMAVGGLFGQAISYALTSAVQGENPAEGALRVWRELTYAPLRTILKAFSTQLVGGPMGQLVNAAINNRDVRTVANTTIPGQVGFAVADFIHNTATELGKNDWKGAADGLVDAVSNVGLVPFRNDVAGLVRAIGAARVGEDPQTVSDAQIVREWKRFEKIDTPHSARNKPDAFYDSIAKVLSIARSMPDKPPKAIVQAAADDLRTALSLAPEESVSAAIEGHMLTKGLSDDDREKLHKWLGDDQRIARVYQHDDALKKIAAEVRKLEGTYPTPFQQQLAQVSAQARYGGTDRWRPMMERVVDEAHQRLLAGDGAGSDIQDLAEAMASHGAQIAPLFKGLERYLSADHVDSTAKARRIAAVLRGRAFDRRADALAERAREARKPTPR